MPLRDFALLMLICAIWASNNILSKYAVGPLGVPPLFFGAVRCAIVAGLTFPWLFPMARPRWRLVTVGLCMGCGSFALMFLAMKYATASSVVVVLQLSVPLTTLLSVLVLGEKIHWRRGLGMVMAVSGVLLVMWNPDGFLFTPGLLFAVASAASTSVGLILMKKVERVRPLQYQSWLAFSSLWPLAILSLIAEPGAWRAAVGAGWAFWSILLFACLVVSLFSHTLFFVIMQKHDANLIAPLTLAAPLLTIALGVAVMGDDFGPRMAAGSALALAGVLMIALRRNKALGNLTARAEQVE